MLEDKSKWRNVTDGGNDDLVKVQVGPFAYQKLRRVDAEARGLLHEPAAVIVDGIVEEVGEVEVKPEVKQRRKSSNKMRKPQENKEEATSE